MWTACIQPRNKRGLLVIVFVVGDTGMKPRIDWLGEPVALDGIWENTWI